MTAKNRKMLAIALIIISVVLLLHDMTDAKQLLKPWAVFLHIGALLSGVWFFVMAKQSEKKTKNP